MSDSISAHSLTRAARWGPRDYENGPINSPSFEQRVNPRGTSGFSRLPQQPSPAGIYRPALDSSSSNVSERSNEITGVEINVGKDAVATREKLVASRCTFSSRSVEGRRERGERERENEGEER